MSYVVRGLCKVISQTGKVLGLADVPLDIGVISYNGASFGRMRNGEADSDDYPFLFAESRVFTLTKLGKYRRAKSERSAAGPSTRTRVARQRRDQPKKNSRRA